MKRLLIPTVMFATLAVAVRAESVPPRTHGIELDPPRVVEAESPSAPRRAEETGPAVTLLPLRAPQAAEATPVDASASCCAEDLAPGDWVAKSEDNICGLSDPDILSHPARVSYDDLMEATPELKRIRDEGIDPGSSQGIQLRQAAVDRVRAACDRVMRSQGHCSVWKKIRHRDGRAISDVSSLVKKEL